MNKTPGLASTKSSLTQQPVLSIIIVTFESSFTLPNLWASLRQELNHLGGAELLLIDNASTDGSVSLLHDMVLDAENNLRRAVVRTGVYENLTNIGFGRACNQALYNARGRYLLLLNPDTVIESGSLSRALAYLEQNLDVGILGPRIRLPDGRLDAPCRRSFKTPAIYFYKLTGLSRIFPRSPRFGRYYLSFLDEHLTVDVDSVIGACMFVRREVIDMIGPMDERFFMYCEDEDWCFRAKEAGWRVVYFAESVVWHLKGASAARRPTRMLWEWHRSIFAFHRKNLAGRYPGWVNGLVYAGMAVSAIGGLFTVLARRTMAHTGTPLFSDLKARICGSPSPAAHL